MAARYSCSQGHEKVLWDITGGWVLRKLFGRDHTDDTRCWYCGRKAVAEVWPSS